MALERAFQSHLRHGGIEISDHEVILNSLCGAFVVDTVLFSPQTHH